MVLLHQGRTRANMIINKIYIRKYKPLVQNCPCIYNTITHKPAHDWFIIYHIKHERAYVSYRFHCRFSLSIFCFPPLCRHYTVHTCTLLTVDSLYSLEEDVSSALNTVTEAAKCKKGLNKAHFCDQLRQDCRLESQVNS